MTFELTFTVPGDPVVKGRPRFTRYGKAYTPKKTADAELAIKMLLNGLVSEPFDRPVGVDAVFFCATKRRTDGDNLMKMLLDAMNEVVVTDDYLVEDVHYRLYRKAEGEEPRTEVYVYELETP